MTAQFVAVHYGDPAPLRRYTESLVAQSDEDWRLVIVDNALAGESSLRSHVALDQRITVVTPERNLGYLGGADFGLKDCGENWTAVSNTDLELSPEFVSELHAYTSNAVTALVGVIAPSITSEQGREHNPFMASRPAPRAMYRRYLMFRWTPVARVVVGLASLRSRRSTALQRTQPAVPGQELYAAHGSLFVVSPAYLQKYRLAYPEFLFGEEIFVAENCRRAGLQQVFVPAMSAIHSGHSSTGVWRATRVLRWQRDSALANLRRVRDV